MVIDDAAKFAVNGVSISSDGTRLLAADTGNDTLHPVNIVGDAGVLVGTVAMNESPIAIGQSTRPDAIFLSGFQKGSRDRSHAQRAFRPTRSV